MLGLPLSSLLSLHMMVVDSGVLRFYRLADGSGCYDPRRGERGRRVNNQTHLVVGDDLFCISVTFEQFQRWARVLTQFSSSASFPEGTVLRVKGASWKSYASHATVDIRLHDKDDASAAALVDRGSGVGGDRRDQRCGHVSSDVLPQRVLDKCCSSSDAFRWIRDELDFERPYTLVFLRHGEERLHMVAASLLLNEYRHEWQEFAYGVDKQQQQPDHQHLLAGVLHEVLQHSTNKRDSQRIVLTFHFEEEKHFKEKNYLPGMY